MKITSIATSINRGAYFYSSIGSGTATLQVSVDGRAFQDHPDLKSITNASGIVLLPECQVKASLSGSADLVLELVASDR